MGDPDESGFSDGAPDSVPLDYFDAEDVSSWKWETTLQQAVEATERSTDGTYTGFTAGRGLEYAANAIDHLNVYFSTNIAEGDSLAGLWEWLRTPVAEGGGADGLVTFNHPGSDPGLDLSNVLGASRDEADFNDLAYVPDLDERVAGIEVNGGDDLDWYLKALSKGWHLDFHANGTSIQDPEAVLLGSTSTVPGPHTLHVEVSGVPAGSAVALLSNTTNGRTSPVQLGVANADGTFQASSPALAPSMGEDWYVAVVCTPDAAGRC